MTLPPSLKWIEADLPDVLEYKAEILAGAKPACALERVPLDLANDDARRGLFARVAREGRHVAILSEGLLVYLMRYAVAELARDLAAQPTIDYWVADFASPRALEQMTERLGDVMREPGAPLLFAPYDGPEFFRDYGWEPRENKSLLRTASRIERLPLALRMLAMLPESTAPGSDGPWSNVCLLMKNH